MKLTQQLVLAAKKQRAAILQKQNELPKKKRKRDQTQNF